MGLMDISEEEKEELLLQNKYLDNIEAGMKLITDLLATKEIESSIDQKFQRLDKLIKEDYLELSKESSLKNEVKVSRRLDRARDSIEEMIKFPFLVNKQEVAIGGHLVLENKPLLIQF